MEKLVEEIDLLSKKLVCQSFKDRIVHLRDELSS